MKNLMIVGLAAGLVASVTAVAAGDPRCGLNADGSRFVLGLSRGTTLPISARDLRELVANSECTPMQTETCSIEVTRRSVENLYPHCSPAVGSPTQIDYISVRMGRLEILGTGDCYEVECQGFGEGMSRERFDNRSYCEQNPLVSAERILALLEEKGFCRR